MPGTGPVRTTPPGAGGLLGTGLVCGVLAAVSSIFLEEVDSLEPPTEAAGRGFDGGWGPAHAPRRLARAIPNSGASSGFIEELRNISSQGVAVIGPDLNGDGDPSTSC